MASSKKDVVQERVDEAKADLQTRFSDARSTQNKVKTKASETGNDRKKFIQDEVLKVVSNDYLLRHFSDYTGTTDADKEAYVRNGLSIEQQIAILAEYGINSKIRGENGIEAELQKAQNRRNDRRTEVKEGAKKVLSEYRKALDDNQARIAKVQESISKLEAQLERAKDKLSDIIAKDDSTAGTMARPGGTFNKDEAVKNQKSLISRLEKDIADKRRELSGLQKIQSQYEKIYDTRASEIRDFLRDENMYLTDNKDVVDKEETADKKEKDEKDGTSTALTTTPKKISKSMLHDFMEAPVERQRTLLRETGNQDIWKMARNLSGFDRRRLRNILNQRLAELDGDTVEFNGVTINKSEFTSMKSMSDDKLVAIRKEIDDFNKNFADKSVDDIEEFEDKMDYVRLGTLLRETQRGAIRKFLADIQPIWWKRETKLSELGKSTFEFAEKQGLRKSKKDEFHDRMRVILGRDKLDSMQKSGRRQLDRTGSDTFSRESDY